MYVCFGATSVATCPTSPYGTLRSITVPPASLCFIRPLNSPTIFPSNVSA